jgi:enoyl-CoA hydratase
MGIVQEIAPNKDAALGLAIDIANAIAGCGLVGVTATLKAAHTALDVSADASAYAELQAAYVSVFGSPNFQEGRKAELENRKPIFQD